MFGDGVAIRMPDSGQTSARLIRDCGWCNVTRSLVLTLLGWILAVVLAWAAETRTA
jgi:hypothetical protein